MHTQSISPWQYLNIRKSAIDAAKVTLRIYEQYSAAVNGLWQLQTHSGGGCAVASVGLPRNCGGSLSLRLAMERESASLVRRLSLAVVS